MIQSLLFILINLSATSLQAWELETQEFFFCFQNTATAVETRTVRVHSFPEENKCAVVYSIDGQDQMISAGRWLSFCKKKAQRVIDNLHKGLWKCKKQHQEVKVFYSSA